MKEQSMAALGKDRCRKHNHARQPKQDICFWGISGQLTPQQALVPAAPFAEPK